MSDDFRGRAIGPSLLPPPPANEKKTYQIRHHYRFVFFQTQNATKPVFGRGSVVRTGHRTPLREAYNAPQTPIVGCEHWHS